MKYCLSHLLVCCSLRFFNADRFQNTMGAIVNEYFKLNYECTHTYTPAQTTRLRNSFLLEHSGQSPCPCIFMVSGQMKLVCHLSGKNRFQKAFKAGVGVARLLLQSILLLGGTRCSFHCHPTGKCLSQPSV